MYPIQYVYSGEELMPDHIIAVPIPVKPKVTFPVWSATYHTLDTLIANDIQKSLNYQSGQEEAYQTHLTKEERNAKIHKFLLKKKNRKPSFIRYQYQKGLADKRARFQGRFVKLEGIKEMIIKGEKLTAKDRSELEEIIYSSNHEELIKAY